MSNLGYGSTVVTRTSTALGTYKWDVIFTETTNPVVISIQSLTTIGTFSVKWIEKKQNVENLVLNGDNFYLQVQNTNPIVKSKFLSLQSPSSAVQSACALMAGVSENDVTVSSAMRPSGGISFICEFYTLVVNQFIDIRVIDSAPVLSLGSDSTQAMLTLTQKTLALVPMTQRIVILGGGGVLSGNFHLSLSGVTTGEFFIYMRIET